VIFDTDVLIFAQRGNMRAAHAIDTAKKRYVSVQTYMELIQGSRDKAEMMLIKEMFSAMRFTVLPFTENIGHRAVVYLEQYALSSGLRSGDAIIAATASEHDLPLISANAKHFRAVKDIELFTFTAR
jgi:predicted nucleic acid-binding protein